MRIALTLALAVTLGSGDPRAQTQVVAAPKGPWFGLTLPGGRDGWFLESLFDRATQAGVAHALRARVEPEQGRRESYGSVPVQFTDAYSDS